MPAHKVAGNGAFQSKFTGRWRLFCHGAAEAGPFSRLAERSLCFLEKVAQAGLNLNGSGTWI
jgi:hypothetical protein